MAETAAEGPPMRVVPVSMAARFPDGKLTPFPLTETAIIKAVREKKKAGAQSERILYLRR